MRSLQLPIGDSRRKVISCCRWRCATSRLLLKIISVCKQSSCLSSLNTELFFVAHYGSSTEKLKARGSRRTADTGSSWLSPRTLYQNPTTSELSAAIHEGLDPSSASPASYEPSSPDGLRVAELAAMLETYTTDLPQNPPLLAPMPLTKPLTIVLSGTTGSLGAHILRTPVSHPLILKIRCFNRSSTALSYHQHTVSHAKPS